MQLLDKLALRIVKRRLNKNKLSGEMELQLHFISSAAAILCLLIHIVHFVVFSRSGLVIHAALNIISIPAYVLMIIRCGKKKYTSSSLILASEICFYSFAVSILSGLGTYVVCYYLFVMVMQVLLPYGTKKTRTKASFGILFMLVINVLAVAYINKVYFPLPRYFELAFMVSNILVVAIGIICCLHIGDGIHHIVNKINKMKIQELKDSANKDMLTGLYNRRYADKILSEFVKLSNGMWHVALLDIDHFKKVNDTYGHDAGDMVLVHVAEFLKNNLRSNDFIFRWGGEEFLLLLNNSLMKDSIFVLENLRKKFEQEAVRIGSREIYITFSVGVSPLNIDDIQGSIKLSDERLYRGKSSGRNVVVGE